MEDKAEIKNCTEEELEKAVQAVQAPCKQELSHTMEEEDEMKDHTQAEIEGVKAGEFVQAFWKQQHPGYTAQELHAAYESNSEDVVGAAMALIKLSQS